jgi:hypothetical protein
MVFIVTSADLDKLHILRLVTSSVLKLRSLGVRVTFSFKEGIYKISYIYPLRTLFAINIMTYIKSYSRPEKCGHISRKHYYALKQIGKVSMDYTFLNFTSTESPGV